MRVILFMYICVCVLWEEIRAETSNAQKLAKTKIYNKIYRFFLFTNDLDFCLSKGGSVIFWVGEEGLRWWIDKENERERGRVCGERAAKACRAAEG